MKTKSKPGKKAVRDHAGPVNTRVRKPHPRLKTEVAKSFSASFLALSKPPVSPSAQYAELREKIALSLADFTHANACHGSEAVEAYREGQLAMLELMETFLLGGSIAPEIAREWRAIRSDIAALKGLNAPSRSLNITVETDPERMGLFARFLRETRFLSSEGYAELWKLCARLSSPPTEESRGRLIAAGEQTDEVN